MPKIEVPDFYHSFPDHRIRIVRAGELFSEWLRRGHCSLTPCSDVEKYPDRDLSQEEGNGPPSGFPG
jgi:hypothetical protein